MGGEMNETDDIGDAEAFNEIERQAKQRKESVRAAMLREEDDDIQDYKKPWIGLTDEDISEIVRGTHNTGSFVRAIEAKLKEKNT
jgi:hypothetical protein